MSRSLILVIVTVCASGSAAQERPYDVVMKDVGAALGALRKSADAPDFARSAEQARRLEQLFEEAENFWTKFKTKDAIDAAAGAQEGLGIDCRGGGSEGRAENEDRARRAREILHQLP